MSASLVYVFRNLGRRRSRTVVGILGIFLTLALLTAIQLGLDSVSVSYIDLVALQAGRADLLILSRDAEPLNPKPFAPRDIEARLMANPQLRGVSPRFFGIVQVGTGHEMHYAVLIGVDPERERQLDLTGIAPEPVLSGACCALSRALADKLKVKAGTNVVVRSIGAYEGLSLKLESICERQLMLPQQIRDYVVVHVAAARSLLHEPDRVHMLAGAFRNPRAYYDARDLHGSMLHLKAAGAAIAADLGLDYEVRLPKASAITAFENFTSPLRAVFGVFALLALTITGLLIYSLISVAVEERIREYAILRTLGAKGRDILFLVLSESLVLCILGVVPGVFAGALVAKGILLLVGLAMGVKGSVIPLEVPAMTLGLTVAAGALLSIGSALIPAIQATRWRIADALDPLRRGQVSTAPASNGQANRGLVGAGLVLSALSVIVFFVVPAALLSGNPSLIGTVVLCLVLSILLGFTLVLVGILPLVQRGVLLGIGWAFTPLTELVARNLERHRRRHLTTALLFTLSVSLVLFMASLVALFSRTALALVEHTHGADLRIHAARAAGEELKGELARVPGVADVAEVRFLQSRSERGVAYDVILSDLVGMKHLWVVPFGIDTNLSKVLFTRQIVSAAGEPTALARLEDGRWRQPSPSGTNTATPLILSLAAARALDVSAGDLVQLSFRLGTDRQEARFRVAAVFSALPGFENFRGRVAAATGSGVLIPMGMFNTMTRSAPTEVFQALYFVKVRGDAARQKAVARDIREQFDVRYRFGLQSVAEQQDEARVLYWATQVFFGMLLTVAVVIAVLALIASMASTVAERRREIGVLKALGLRQRGLFRLFLGEAIVLTVSAGMGGGAIGFALAWLFVLQAGVLMEIATVFALPYVTLLATLAVSILAGVLAAHLPTRHLLRKSAAEILRP